MVFEVVRVGGTNTLALVVCRGWKGARGFVTASKRTKRACGIAEPFQNAMNCEQSMGCAPTQTFTYNCYFLNNPRVVDTGAEDIMLPLTLPHSQKQSCTQRARCTRACLARDDLIAHAVDGGRCVLLDAGREQRGVHKEVQLVSGTRRDRLVHTHADHLVPVARPEERGERERVGRVKGVVDAHEQQQQTHCERADVGVQVRGAHAVELQQALEGDVCVELVKEGELRVHDDARRQLVLPELERDKQHCARQHRVVVARAAAWLVADIVLDVFRDTAHDVDAQHAHKDLGREVRLVLAPVDAASSVVVDEIEAAVNEVASRDLVALVVLRCHAAAVAGHA